MLGRSRQQDVFWGDVLLLTIPHSQAMPWATVQCSDLCHVGCAGAEGLRWLGTGSASPTPPAGAVRVSAEESCVHCMATEVK